MVDNILSISGLIHQRMHAQLYKTQILIFDILLPFVSLVSCDYPSFWPVS